MKTKVVQHVDNERVRPGSPLLSDIQTFFTNNTWSETFWSLSIFLHILWLRLNIQRGTVCSTNTLILSLNTSRRFMYPFAMPFLESVSNCTPSSLNWSTLSYWVPSELLILGVKSLFVAVLKLTVFVFFLFITFLWMLQNFSTSSKFSWSLFFSVFYPYSLMVTHSLQAYFPNHLN